MTSPAETTTVVIAVMDTDGAAGAGAATKMDEASSSIEVSPAVAEELAVVAAMEEARKDGAGGVVDPHTDITMMRKSSISEAAEDAGGHWNAPTFLRWLEYPFHVSAPDTGRKLPEAAAWAMDSVGRGPLTMVNAYVGNAILRLATAEAGCGNKGVCHGEVYGFRPSSLLTLLSCSIGVFTALTMPIVGAIVDHTQYRHLMGALSGFIAVVLSGIEISIGPDTWFMVLCIKGFQTYALLVHVTAVFAYLPDLSLKESTTAHYTTRFYFIQFSGQFVYLSILLTLGKLHGTNSSIHSSIRTAKDAGILTVIFSSCFIGYAWTFLFRSRPALSRVPEGSTLLTTGFVQVGKTARAIVQNYSALKWFMFSLLWSPEAGAGVIQTIAVTFFVVELKFTGQEIAKINLVLIVGNMFGSLWAKIACRLFNPLNSYRLGLSWLAIWIAGSCVGLKGEESLNAAYGFGAMWGVGMGWTYPSQRVLFCTLIPKGQETEMMGLFAFAGQIVGWLAPLLFTVINENGADIRWGVSVLPFFVMFAVICTLPMGRYQDAVEVVAKASEKKLESVFEATLSLSLNNLSKMNHQHHGKTDGGKGVAEPGPEQAQLVKPSNTTTTSNAGSQPAENGGGGVVGDSTPPESAIENDNTEMILVPDGEDKKSIP